MGVNVKALLQMDAWQSAGALTKRGLRAELSFEEHVAKSAASINVRPATPLRAGSSPVHASRWGLPTLHAGE